jgi:hypothetical protein
MVEADGHLKLLPTCDKWLFLASKLGRNSDLHSEIGPEIPLLKVHVYSCFLNLNG